MKKFLSLLSATAIAITSFATVASAAMATDNYKPEWIIEVDSVDDGFAYINVGIEVDAPLAYSTEDDRNYTGVAITSAELRLLFDSEIFDPESAYPMDSAEFASGDYNFEEGYAFVQHSWGNKIAGTAVTTEDSNYIFYTQFEVQLLDNTMTAEALKALDYVDVSLAIVEIGTWDNVRANRADITKYRSDGAGNFDCAYTLVKAVEPDEPEVPDEPAADVTIKGAYKTTNSAWTAGNTLWWGVDFAAGKFPGEARATISNGSKSKVVAIGAAGDFAIGGAVSFGVYAIVGDSKDALSLTVEAEGAETGTSAAAVAYADAAAYVAE